MTTPDEKATRQELNEVEAYLVQLTERRNRVEGYRDTLVRKLCDFEVAHDRQYVAARKIKGNDMTAEQFTDILLTCPNYGTQLQKNLDLTSIAN